METTRKKGVAETLRAVRFGIVGLGATATHMIVAQGVFALTPATAPLANLVGFAVAFLAGFLGHHYFTFGRAAPFGQAFRRYGLIALGGFLVNNVVLWGLVETDIVNEATALAIAILIVPAGTYVASRFWGFVAKSSHIQQ